MFCLAVQPRYCLKFTSFPFFISLFVDFLAARFIRKIFHLESLEQIQEHFQNVLSFPERSDKKDRNERSEWKHFFVCLLRRKTLGTGVVQQWMEKQPFQELLKEKVYDEKWQKSKQNIALESYRIRKKVSWTNSTNSNKTTYNKMHRRASSNVDVIPITMQSHRKDAPKHKHRQIHKNTTNTINDFYRFVLRLPDDRCRCGL